jgi:hypothetical protein
MKHARVKNAAAAEVVAGGVVEAEVIGAEKNLNRR